MSEMGPSAVYYLLAIVLVASSLVSMRLPIAKAAKMLLAWVAIFGVGFALFTFRSDFSEVGDRLYSSAVGEPEQVGDNLRIPISEDGHFWVRGRLNGHVVRFLVDSGASITTISARTAEESGVGLSGRRSVVNTANGQIAVTHGYVERLEIGPIERQGFRVNVSASDTTNILGMNFLSSLDGWRVERGNLVLQP